MMDNAHVAGETILNEGSYQLRLRKILIANKQKGVLSFMRGAFRVSHATVWDGTCSKHTCSWNMLLQSVRNASTSTHKKARMRADASVTFSLRALSQTLRIFSKFYWSYKGRATHPVGQDGLNTRVTNGYSRVVTGETLRASAATTFKTHPAEMGRIWKLIGERTGLSRTDANICDIACEILGKCRGHMAEGALEIIQKH